MSSLGEEVPSAVIAPKVVVLGLPVNITNAVQAALADAGLPFRKPSLEVRPSLGLRDLETFDLILIDAGERALLNRLSASLPVRRRCRAVVHLRHHTAGDLWAVMKRAPPAPILMGDPIADREIGRHLLDALYASPVREAVDPVLDRICSPSQKELILEFLYRANRTRPARIAQELNVSPRTLRRLCDDRSLPPPRTLHCLARVLLGIAWVVRSGGNLADAGKAAGYRDPSSFRRVARETLGIAPSELRAAWMDHDALAAHLASALRVPGAVDGADNEGGLGRFG